MSGAVAAQQKALLQEVRKEIAPLNQQVEAFQADLAAVGKKLDARMAPLSESLAQNTQAIANLQSRIGPIAGQIVDKDQMDLELLKLKKAYQQNLSAEISGLQKQIGLLTERIQRLESRPAPGAGSPAPAGTGGAGPAGGIREQPLP